MAPSEGPRRSIGVSALARMCEGSSTPNASCTRNSSLLGAATAAADVTVPNGPNGAAQVISVSGKTACDVWPDHVDCIVEFDNPPPSKSGPANAVTMTLSGQITYMQADWGARPGTTLNYGTTYTANGWTISASMDGTRFSKGSVSYLVSTAGISRQAGSAWSAGKGFLDENSVEPVLTSAVIRFVECRAKDADECVIGIVAAPDMISTDLTTAAGP